MPPAARLLESRIVPPGVLTNDDVKPYFIKPGQPDGVGDTSKPWPHEKEAALRKIMLEGALVQHSQEYRQVRQIMVLVASAPSRLRWA